MNFIVQIILPYIVDYKYIAIFIVTFLSAFILPIPSGTLLIISSAFASQGYFDIYKILIVVISANILGDTASYFLAKSYAKRFFYKVPFIKKIIISSDFLSIEKAIRKYPGLLIIVSRFEVLSTLSVNLMCGISRTPYKKFLSYEIVGTILNVFFYAGMGYMFSESWEIVNQIIGDFTIIFFLLIVILISIFWKKVIHKLHHL